jgi:hypothetical protein
VPVPKIPHRHNLILSPSPKFPVLGIWISYYSIEILILTINFRETPQQYSCFQKELGIRQVLYKVRLSLVASKGDDEYREVSSFHFLCSTEMKYVCVLDDEERDCQSSNGV